MKAVVLETREREAAVLVNDGTVRIVRGTYNVGDIIDYRLRPRFVQWIAAAVAMVVLVGGSATMWIDRNYVTYAEVSLDVNPSIVYSLNKRDRVLGHGFCIMQHSGGQLMVEHTTVYIDDICVDEKARGQGVGKALYEHILAFAREQGAYNVTLNVWSCNPGAMAFYEKLGLVQYKVGMEQIL